MDQYESSPPEESPITQTSSPETTLKFYYVDAYEDPKKPGTVHLFGKIAGSSPNTYASCCVTLDNIPRRIYLLPNKSPTGEFYSLSSVREEFTEKANEWKIKDFEMIDVEKKYAFDINGVPDVANYVEVTYPVWYETDLFRL